MVKAGTYGPTRRENGKVVRVGPRRQLWWCYPHGRDDRTDRHRFAEPLPRRLLPATEEHTCWSCVTKLEPHEGPPHTRGYDFPAATIAAALVAVGNGSSYVRAARTARTTHGWSREMRKRPRRSRGANGTLAGDWVGLFGPVVTGPVLDGECWPEVVGLDEQPFVATVPRRRGRPKQETSWSVFGAYAGLTDRAGTGYLFRLHASPVINAEAAAAWLTSIPGRPKIVVADGSGVWARALRLAWPDVYDPDTGELLEAAPRLVSCEYHLRVRLRSVLRATGVLPPRELDAPPPDKSVPWPMNQRNQRPSVRPLRVQAEPAEPVDPTLTWTPQPSRNRTGYRRLARRRDGELYLAGIPNGGTHPLIVAADRAFDTVEDWDALVTLATRWQAQPLGHWLELNGPAIRAQIAHRRPGVPRTTGGLEAEFRLLKRMLKDRAKLLTNTVRTNRMLDLMTLQFRGVASETDYTRRILEHAAATGGHVPAQRQAVTGATRLHR